MGPSPGTGLAQDVGAGLRHHVTHGRHEQPGVRGRGRGGNPGLRWRQRAAPLLGVSPFSQAGERSRLGGKKTQGEIDDDINMHHL